VPLDSLFCAKPILDRVGVGFCGALTTFSTYSMDVLKFSQQGELGKAAAYVAVSNLVGIGGAASGYKIARTIFR
jgi:fluoride exporter